MEPMDELEAIRYAEYQLRLSEKDYIWTVFLPRDVVRALLARAKRSHD